MFRQKTYADGDRAGGNSREGNQTKIDHLKEDIAKITEERNQINAKWLSEKQKSEDLTQIKKRY